MRARALLACGRLDEARDECNAGITEAKENQERIVAVSLGSMRAQIHTAEGEDQDAVQILNTTEQLNAEVLEEKEGGEKEGGEKGGDMGGDMGERKESRDSSGNDRHCLDPAGLCEILMLKGDLLVEISQAEGLSEQIRLKSKAMHCFQRAKNLSTWILQEAGWMDQGTSTVGDGAYNKKNSSVGV